MSNKGLYEIWILNRTVECLNSKLVRISDTYCSVNSSDSGRELKTEPGGEGQERDQPRNYGAKRANQTSISIYQLWKDECVGDVSLIQKKVQVFNMMAGSGKNNSLNKTC